MAAASDVVIVGGGAAGCAVAYYLAQAGVKATLIEPQGVGSQASGYSAGGVNPLHGFLPILRPLALASYQLHLALWEALKSTTGRDCHHRIISMLMVAYDEAEFPAWQETLEVYEATAGFAAHWLEASELQRLQPGITPQAIRGLYLHGNGVVDSHLLTVLMAEAAEQAGARRRVGQVLGLPGAHGRITGVMLEEGVMACEQVVLAMGPWAKTAEPWLHCAIPIAPMKGEILRMELPGLRLEHDLIGPDILLCSRPGPQVWCASSEEWCGFDQEISASARQTLLHNAVALLPAMAEARLVQQTACLRPVAPDWHPIIGKAAGWHNVYLATGGAKKGILFSPGMGKAIADLITTGSTSLPIEQCAPQRFPSIAAAGRSEGGGV